MKRDTQRLGAGRTAECERCGEQKGAYPQKAGNHDPSFALAGAMVPAQIAGAGKAPALDTLYDWLFFSMFQNTGAGVLKMPSMFLRTAAGRYHWPRNRCVVISVLRFCTAAAISFCLA